MEANKVVLYNEGVLRGKYGPLGWEAIQNALAQLVAADAGRGVSTQLLALDSPAEMHQLGAEPVTDPRDPKANKRAVDAVVAARDPAYLVLLGAPDSIPHQPLANPLAGTGDDLDPVVDSDLPYACDGPFSLEIADFMAPRRVLGRIPDIKGKGDSHYLVGLLQRAAQWQPRGADQYTRHFAVSTETWRDSTRRSMRNLFGTVSALRFAPPDGPDWEDERLSALCHFFNLHGAQDDPSFYGESDSAFPVAHTALLLPRKITPGTLVAAECCYGAELYDPADVAGLAGLCNAYLGEGACGFFGSTTIAYGPEEGNGAADYICQYFVRSVLQGASLGRAALQARQQYVEKTAPLTPIDLKTLAQFCLLGDPSIHPVAMPRQVKFRTRLRHPDYTTADRRAALIDKARELRASVATALSRPDGTVSKRFQARLDKLAAERGFGSAKRRLSFAVHGASQTGRRPTLAARRRSQGGGVFHLIFAQRRDRPTQGKIVRTALLVVREMAGEITSVREYVAR